MPHHSFERPELYAMVWREPMRTLAGRLGVSDVGLAKACRKALIPVPPRGHWAKLAAGKPSPQIPLPRAKAAPERVVIAPATPKPPPSPRAQAVLDTFELVAIEVPTDLTRPHRIVRDWIKQNLEAHRQHRRNGWGSGPPDLTTPLEARRLWLYSAMLTALEKAGFVIEAGRIPDVELTASKAGEAIAFRIYERQRKTRRPITESERRWPENKGKTDMPDLARAGDLVLKIKTYTRGAMAEDYRDQKAPLEEQLAQIVPAFEAGVVELTAWREDRAREAERYRRAEAHRRRMGEWREDVEQRRTALRGEAERWGQAAQLRAYVAAALASPLGEKDGTEAWARWALSEADRLDPLVGGGVNRTLPPEPPVFEPEDLRG